MRRRGGPARDREGGGQGQEAVRGLRRPRARGVEIAEQSEAVVQGQTGSRAEDDPVRVDLPSHGCPDPRVARVVRPHAPEPAPRHATRGLAVLRGAGPHRGASASISYEDYVVELDEHGAGAAAFALRRDRRQARAREGRARRRAAGVHLAGAGERARARRRESASASPTSTSARAADRARTTSTRTAGCSAGRARATRARAASSRWPSGRTSPSSPTRSSTIPSSTRCPTASRPRARFPRCVSPEGVYDMVGNLHEWVDEEPTDGHGRFRGGWYGDAENNGPGASTSRARTSRRTTTTRRASGAAPTRSELGRSLGSTAAGRSPRRDGRERGRLPASHPRERGGARGERGRRRSDRVGSRGETRSPSS